MPPAHPAPGRLDLVPTSQRFDHALHVPPALAGVLDEIEILVGADLLDPDEHRGAPWRSHESTTKSAIRSRQSAPNI